MDRGRGCHSRSTDYDVIPIGQGRGGRPISLCFSNCVIHKRISGSCHVGCAPRAPPAGGPNPAMEGEMEVQIPMDLHGRHNRTITCQGIGGIRPRTGSGGRMRQGRGEAPRAKPLERGGPRRANRAFRLAPPAERERPERQIERSGWLRQRNAKEKSPLPVQETKPFPRVPPAPPKEEPFDCGIGEGEGAGSNTLWIGQHDGHGLAPGEQGPVSSWASLQGEPRRLRRSEGSQ